MKRWAILAAGVLALAAATPALARDDAPADRPVAEEVAALTAQLIDKLGALGDALGIDAPLLPAEAMTSALGAALPVLPDGDDRTWDTSFGFDFNTDRVANRDLEPDAGGRTVLGDARACLAEGQPGEIVHFERFARGDVRGHRCVVLVQDESGEAWVLASRTFAEGPDRRLSADYAVATAVAGDGDAARRLIEDRLDQNVALAGVLADYAFEMFLMKEASSDPLTMDNLSERLARAQARLAVIAGEAE